MLVITANRFPCGDDKWVVFNMLPDAAYWSRMCQAMEVDDLIEDERFADSRSRYKNMAVLIGLIDEALAKRSRDEWAKFLTKQASSGDLYSLYTKYHKTLMPLNWACSQALSTQKWVVTAP
jgi:hypothetical protein